MGFLDSITGADDAKKAAAEQAAGFETAGSMAQQAGGEVNQLYRLSPQVMNAGLGNLSKMFGPNGTPDFNALAQTPEYQFALNEGLRAIDASGSARGMSQSGAQQKALMRYGQGLANQNVDNYINRNATLAQVGGSGTANLANNIMGVADRRSDAATGAAGARASGHLAKAGIKNGLFSAALGAAMPGIGGALGAGMSALGGMMGGAGGAAGAAGAAMPGLNMSAINNGISSAIKSQF